MASTYTIGDRIVSIVFTGTATLEETIDLLQAVFDDPAYRAGMPILMDARPSAATWGWEIDDYWRFAKRLGEMTTAHGVPMAVLVETQLGFGEGRMVASIAEGHGIAAAVFYDEDEATRWLLGE